AGDLIRQSAHLAHEAQIGLQEFDVRIVGGAADVLLRTRTLGTIAPDDDDLQAPARKPAGDLLADPVGSPRDQSDPAVMLGAHLAETTAARTDANTLIKLPSGSRNSIDRLPQGCVFGSMTKSVTMPLRRTRSRSTSSTSKSRITERLAAAVVAPAAC